jgi:hypothetical protein
MHSKKITSKSVIIVGLEAEELKAEGYDSRMFRPPDGTILSRLCIIRNVRFSHMYPGTYITSSFLTNFNFLRDLQLCKAEGHDIFVAKNRNTRARGQARSLEGMML